MKKIFLTLSLMLSGVALYAQDIYKAETFSSEDLNGTARYVGMGGAMGALGADLSVMGSNPAGIGLYRKNDVSLTGSVIGQPTNAKIASGDKTKGSFDQAGIVVVTQLQSDAVKFLNFGFNYQKRKNFKNFIGLDNIALGGLSQSMEAANLASMYGRDNYSNDYVPIADVAYNTYMFDPIYDAQGNVVDWNPSQAQSYDYQRLWSGGIQQYDFNISMNVRDKMYFGISAAIYNLKWESDVLYGEQLIEAGSAQTHPYYMSNHEYVDGVGVDFKFGAIFRPIEESPFRFGVALTTPTFYDLSGSGSLYMLSPYQNISSTGAVLSETTEAGYNTGYDIRIRTPWKVNLSLATTIGTKVALGAEYEARFMHTASIGYPDNYNYDWGFSSISADKALNSEIDRYTNTVHTFKVGAEAQVLPNFFLRAGYNYVSAPFKKDAILNYWPEEGTNHFESESAYNAVGTDFVNLKGINRITCGLGYRGKHIYGDVAFQYQNQKADFYPFHLPSSDTNYRTNSLRPQTLDLKRYNVMFTLGYRF
ncbi:MAG: hypothetical protein IJ816_04195 [Alloprevotella sp.]|nr:hypothetical protein [Alloprevotella sp.]